MKKGLAFLASGLFLGLAAPLAAPSATAALMYIAAVALIGISALLFWRGK